MRHHYLLFETGELYTPTAKLERESYNVALRNPLPLTWIEVTRPILDHEWVVTGVDDETGVSTLE